MIIIMSIWKLLCYWIGLRSDPGPRYYKFSESTQVTLKTLSKHEGLPEHKLAQNLIAAGLSEYYSTDELMQKWEILSARERDVAALVCLGYSNQEIADRLVITTGTVKTHITNLLRKFQLTSRYELRNLLAEWDFSAWEK
jgi:DNA-binding CsgD family transcriptional regulator